ncbi:hypothetical protein QJS83_14965 [Bdellovibrio sp. 22V]|uniref:hypothetical protein n=1 Tax=Bdellovibrio sp. 22V TaxID=3044166 RepID=UPI002543A989|nr:hypothetical protein [Bdellovibrio sp. 22V]WII71764.1 hypothetical protein QJS83_14965 [Bdellovibrio sp. 22V]
MANYTPAQVTKIMALAENASVVEARKVITLFRAGDDSYALFRLQAANHIQRVTICAALKRKALKGDVEYAEKRIHDGNTMFKDFYAALNAAAGYTVIEVM